jgi:hypothetical protein
VINFQIKGTPLPSSQAIAEINRFMQDSNDAIDILKQEMNEGIETISSSQVIQPRSIDEEKEENSIIHEYEVQIC